VGQGSFATEEKSQHLAPSLPTDLLVMGWRELGIGIVLTLLNFKTRIQAIVEK